MKSMRINTNPCCSKYFLGGQQLSGAAASGFFAKIGQLLGGDVPKKKLVRTVPTASNPIGVEIKAPSHGTNVPVNAKGDITFVDGSGRVYASNGEVAFTIPEPQSMTMSQAVEWYRKQAPAIREVLERTDMSADLRLQEAIKLREAQQQAARNAIDPDLRAEFESLFPVPSEQLMVKAGKEGYSGEVLMDWVYKELTELNDNIRYPDMAGGCFVKGTKIHLKDGWKRIEDVQVGDWVLSSPEDGTGKPEYKRVVKTFVHHDKTIVEICVYRFEPDKQEFLVAATGNHPFWVEGQGWTRADLLERGHRIRTMDGTSLKVRYQRPVYSIVGPSQRWENWTATPEVTAGIGWHQASDTCRSDFDPWDADLPVAGYLMDCANFQNAPANKGLLQWDDLTEENRLRVTVYNLEVEDFHTYYVCNGLFVHNTNCADNGVREFKGRGTTTYRRDGGSQEFTVFEKMSDAEVAWMQQRQLYAGKGDLAIALRNGEVKVGDIVVVKSPHSGTYGKDDIVIYDAEGNFESLDLAKRQRWLRWEDGVHGRLMDGKGKRCEYALVFEDPVTHKLRAKHIEGHALDVDGSHVFIDRKLVVPKGKRQADGSYAKIFGLKDGKPDLGQIESVETLNATNALANAGLSDASGWSVPGLIRRNVIFIECEYRPRLVK